MLAKVKVKRSIFSFGKNEKVRIDTVDGPVRLFVPKDEISEDSSVYCSVVSAGNSSVIVDVPGVDETMRVALDLKSVDYNVTR